MKIRKMIVTLMLGSILLTGCGSNSTVERETRPAESISEEKTEQAEATEVQENSSSKVLIAYSH